MKLKIFAALHEEGNSGWLWVARPHIESRTLAKVTNCDTKRSVFCECRVLDENFRRLYNGRPYTVDITAHDVPHAIVIGDWYRKTLGMGDTGTWIELKIEPLNGSDWAGIKAGYRHPDPIVRITTRLGALSVWLATEGLLLAIFVTVWPAKALIAAIIVMALGLASWLAVER